MSFSFSRSDCARVRHEMREAEVPNSLEFLSACVPEALHAQSTPHSGIAEHLAQFYESKVLSSYHQINLHYSRNRRLE